MPLLTLPNAVLEAAVSAVVDGPVPVIITEVGTGGITVTLAGPDRPNGRPRKDAAFESGGELAHEAIYLPGRRAPVFQVQQARERPLVFKGAFRDHLYGADGGVEPYHARAQRNRLQQIRGNARLVRITWGDQQRLGLLTDAKFGEESAHDIAYELTFAIATGVEGTGNTEPERSSPVRPADVATLLRGQIAARLAEVNVFARVLAAVDLARSISNGIMASLEQLSTAADALSTSTPGDAGLAALRVTGLARYAQVQVTATRTATIGAAPQIRDQLRDPDSVAALWMMRDSMHTTLDDTDAQLQAVRAAMQRQINASPRLYTVRVGDTLESIARTQLGDMRRTGDLGVRAGDLVPGLVILLPAVQ